MKLLLLLDFDGTLTPIRRDPDKVRLGKRMHGILKILSGQTNINVAIISGRELGDIRKKIGLKDVVYAGNHGLELSGPNVEFILPAAIKAKKTI